MNALEIKNLRVKLGEEEIIKGISFNIPEGIITALIGPNGAGKSVLLKTIIGLFPYEGEIKIFDKDHREMLHLIGYLPQYYEVDSLLPLTVYEFLSFSCEDNKRIIEVLKEIDMEKYKNHPISKLSGGQRQRILFGRAILNHPKIVLLDEPMSEIDILGQKEFYEIIKNLNKNFKITFIVVTHEITVVNSFADKVLCLNRNLVCDGPVNELFQEEVLRKLYKRDIFIYPFNKEIKDESS